MVRHKDGEGLGARDASVIRALGCLDSIGDLGSCFDDAAVSKNAPYMVITWQRAKLRTRAVGAGGVFALGVAGGRVKRRADRGSDGQKGNESGEAEHLQKVHKNSFWG